jgi:hypothetical protein
MKEKKQITFKEWRDTIYKPPTDESYYFEWDGMPIDGKYILRDMWVEYKQYICLTMTNQKTIKKI